MKEISILDFVSLAKSKEECRYNLCQVYRDIDCLVATDGNRLHHVNGQPKIEKGHFLSGLDAEFPDYSMVMPKTKESGKYQLSSDDIANIKNITALVKAYDKVSYTCRFTFDKTSKFTFTKGGISLTCPLTGEYEGQPLELALNLNYLNDALKGVNYMGASIRLWSPTSAVIVDRVIEGHAAMGLIMPLRLEK